MVLLLGWSWMWIEAWFARRFLNRRGGHGRRRSTRPAYRRSQAKPAWVARQIVRLKALMPDAGCRVIASVFNRRFARHADSPRRMTDRTAVRDVEDEARSMGGGGVRDAERFARRIPALVQPHSPASAFAGLDASGGLGGRESIRSEDQGRILVRGMGRAVAGLLSATVQRHQQKNGNKRTDKKDCPGRGVAWRYANDEIGLEMKPA